MGTMPESLQLYRCENSEYKCRINIQRQTVQVLPFYTRKGKNKREWTHRLTMRRLEKAGELGWNVTWETSAHYESDLKAKCSLNHATRTLSICTRWDDEWDAILHRTVIRSYKDSGWKLIYTVKRQTAKRPRK